jgi:hypothetical protein
VKIDLTMSALNGIYIFHCPAGLRRGKMIGHKGEAIKQGRGEKERKS